jgi:carbamoylphosphate synthase small subunit
VRSWCEEPSNFRCEGEIDSWLKKQNVIGLYDIDTRALTKVLREAGVMNGMIIVEIPRKPRRISRPWRTRRRRRSSLSR